MKKIRKTTLILFFFCIVSLFSLTFININSVSKTFFKDIVGTNITVRDIRAKGLCIQMKDINIRDLNNEEVGNIKSGSLYFNPFLPSRLSRVSFSGGNLKITQYKDGSLNLNKILRSSEKVSRTSYFSRVRIKNIDVLYNNMTFKKAITKKVTDVFGTIDNLLESEYDINVSGKSLGSVTGQKEELGMRLTNKPNLTMKILSLFSFDNKSKLDTVSTQEFKFKNLDIDDALYQFATLDILDIKKGKLDGSIKLVDYRNKTSLFGDLDVGISSGRYKDYDEEITNAKAKVKMDGKTVKVNGNIVLDNNDKLGFLIAYTNDTSDLGIVLKTNNLSFDKINKYKPVKKLNLGIKGAIKGTISTKLNVKDKVNIKDIKVDLKSNQLNVKDVDIRDIKLLVDKNEKDKLYNISYKSKVVKKPVDIDLEINSKYDMDKNNIFGKYLVKSNIKEVKLDDIKGDINLEPMTKGYITLDSNQLYGKVELKDKKLIANLNAKQYIPYSNKKDINIKALPSLKNAVYDLTTNKFNANLVVNASGTFKGKNVSIVSSSNIDNQKAVSNAKIMLPMGNVAISGTTTFSNLRHDYNIQGNLQALDLMQMFNIDNDRLNKDVPISVSAKLSGVKKDISVSYDINSKHMAYIVDAYDVNLKGYANHILDDKARDIKARLNMNEAWFKYHRLKELGADITYDGKNLLIKDINNEFVKGNIIYDLKTKEVHSQLDVNKFMIYSIYDIPDINLDITTLKVEASGRLDNINAVFKIEPSTVVIKDKLIGYLDGLATLKGNILSLNFKLNGNDISGIYDTKKGYIDIKLDIDQQLNDILKIDGFSSKLKTNIQIAGKKDDIFMSIDGKLSDVKYKNMKLPDIDLSAYYEKGNMNNILKTGILHVDKFNVVNSSGKKIYNTSFVVALDNLNIDYNLKDKIFDLSDLGKDYSGKLKVNTIVKGNVDNIFADLVLESKQLTVDGHNITNLILDGQINKDGLNINQGYLEYQNNPILIEGFAKFKPLDYTFNIVAQNFNLEFLNIYPNISNATGIANVNFSARKGVAKGNIDIKNFGIKTGEVDINNLNVNINMTGKDVYVNEFNGNINGGTAEVKGEFTIPDIPDNVSGLDNISIGRMNLDMLVDHVRLPISGNDIVTSANLSLKGEQLDGNVQINSAKIEDLSFVNKFNSKKTKKDENILTKKLNIILNNILRRYVVNINIDMDEPVIVDVPSYLVLKDIYGEIQGSATLTIANGIPTIIGSFNTSDGKFTLNNSEFSVEVLDVTMDDRDEGIDPLINLRAVTVINGETVEIIVNSNLSNLKIDFRSQTNKSRSEILSLLAFKGIKFDKHSIGNVSSNVVNIAAETAVNQFISKFTNKIGRKIGLTKFDIGTNIGNKDKIGFRNLGETAALNLHLQGKIAKKKNIYWNTKFSIPFNTNKNNFKYDVNMSYNLGDGLGANVGIKSNDLDRNDRANNNINFYTGVNYSNKFNNLGEFFEKINNRFEKREKLIQNKKQIKK